MPPKPSGVTFATKYRELDDEGERAEITQTVTWHAPKTAGVEIKVYGVTRCMSEPASPKPDTSGPCLVEHTALPGSILHLLATAPASRGSVSWTWTEYTGCSIGLESDPEGPAYVSVVVAAYSPAGQSIFAIAEPGEWWEPGPGVIVC